MINLANIKVILGKGTILQKEILSNLSLTIAAGEFIVVVGGNGAGKSTLLNMIAGLIPPDAGKVLVDGHNISRLSRQARASIAALVMQDPKVGTMERMTIEENLSFAYLRGQTRNLTFYKNKMRHQLFRDKLSVLHMGLEDRMQELVGNLSGGQRQALSLVMAMIANSKILLLDEITAALDPQMAEMIMHITAHLVREEKRTTIMITHNMQHALSYGDRTIVLKGGKIQQIFTQQERLTMTPAQLAASFER